MDNINKTFNLKNGKKYIIELNDISEYEKKNEIMVNLWLVILIVGSFLIIVNCSFMTKCSHLSLFQIFLGLTNAIMFISFVVLYIQTNKNINNIVDDYINCFENIYKNIDFSKSISIDKNYNILYFNKNKELHILCIKYNNIRYIANSNNTIKLIGKYNEDGIYMVTLYLPVELSKEYKKYIKEN